MARADRHGRGVALATDEVGHNAPAAEWLPLDALVPHPRNPRVHGDEVTKLARTILRTAWGAPIVAQWRASGRHRVIAGHGRLLAAREILRGVEVDGELRGGAEHRFDPSAPGPALLPVRVVRVSDAEADAMTLADNARGIQGVDDAALIVEMAAQFGRDAAVMSDIGFDGVALDALVKSAGDAVLAGALGADKHGDPTERGTSPEDQADGYADRTIKRVTLFFDADGYDDFIRKADALLESRSVGSYTDLVVQLVGDASR